MNLLTYPIGNVLKIIFFLQVAKQTGPPPRRCRTPPSIAVNGIGEGSYQRKRSPNIPCSVSKTVLLQNSCTKLV